MDGAGKGAVTPPEVPNSHPNFIKKRVAPILFYKFYKFRAKFTFIFSNLNAERVEMGTEKVEMGTEKVEMGTKLQVDLGS
jgi:hypothetical protein